MNQHEKTLPITNALAYFAAVPVIKNLAKKVVKIMKTFFIEIS
jgi:hypothetical protein